MGARSPDLGEGAPGSGAPGGASPGPWVEVLAPAKVNLVLDLLGRRMDGFHALESVLLAVDLCDRVRVRARWDRRDVELSVQGPMASADVPHGAENLVVRAAVPWAELAGAGLSIELHKAVPSQAGLGGGSSDAAAASLAARTALGLGPRPAEELASLAALGSDTVFFAAAESSGLALVQGRGEEVSVLAPWERELVIALLTPEVEAPTKRVYEALGLAPGQVLRGSRARGQIPWSGLPARELGELVSNDLEGAAAAAIPELARWRELFKHQDLRHWRLCGSGSSWFGVYGDERAARRALCNVEAAAEREGLGIRLLTAARPAGFGRRLCAEASA